jgi:hypothetical protein
VLTRPSASADLAVHRARVTGWRASRGEAERWLRDVPLESLGLDPEELLYIPRLRVRVPASVGGVARMPDHILAKLRALLVGADSGSGDRFSPDRPYRFTSRARYASWLVALWVKHGSAQARTAFIAATGEASLARWQRVALLPDAPLLVTTVARLADIGMAARWIAQLEPGDSAIACHAIETHFAVPIAMAELPAAPEPAEPAATMTAPASTQTMDQRRFLRETVTWMEERGNNWRPLPLSARTLLLTALAIARAPASAVAQGTNLAAAIADLAASSEVSAASVGSTLHTRPIMRPSLATTDTPAAFRLPCASGKVAETSVATPTLLPALRPKAAPEAPIPTRYPAETAREEELPPPSGSPGPAATRQPISPVTLIAPDTSFTTGYGGLLFLINAFIALDLYPDFSRPKGNRLSPSPLWLADRIGRYQFGRPYRRDPLSTWIAAHAEAGRLPHTWRAEPDWLVGFSVPATPCLSRSRNRTTLWHPADFPLFDGDSRRYRPQNSRPPRLLSRAPARLPTAHRWAACLALYLDARLKHLAGGGLALLAQSARIDVRDLDIRATFDLDLHPIGLRLAGLDRNPGWQPAEGRSIAFAFV